LTRSLLVLARAQTREEPIELEPVRLRPLIETVVASCDVPQTISVRVECPADLAALAQKDIAEQILSNLLGNALKHTPEGLVLVSARFSDSTVIIEIADQGPGIGAAGERVFDRFYTGTNGRRDGFGLGLAIVREAVRALGGNIEIDSDPARGTTARVTLAAMAV
jgi:signal transduction histidine kinase